jgi:signal transduction histidine kinase
VPVNWRRAIQINLGLVVLVMAVLGLVVSAAVIPASGVVPENIGGVVRSVEPGSPGWRDGIREGDVVTDLDTSEGNWHIATIGGEVRRDSSKSDQVKLLRSFIPWSIVALLVAAFAALLAYRGHPASAVLVPIALLLAAQPLFFTGSVPGALVAGIALFAGGGLAVAFARWRTMLAVPLVAGLALSVLWVVSTLVLPAAFDAVDVSRGPAAAGFSVVGFAVVADRRRILDFMTGRSGPGFVDLLYLGLAVALLIAGIFGSIPFLPALVVTVAAVLVYPFWRRATVASFERLVTSQARRDASIRATEDERGRLAREIHDSPLQELSGVIRRLEAVPGAEREADTLRAVAGQLRDVATALHPPVLQDLGLAAAIEDLRDQFGATAPDWQVSVEVDDLTSAGRPSAEVELAAFRVTQEATANAIAHSGGQRLGIRGSVTRNAVELAISDDGHGLLEEDTRTARRAGHFGLDSMRERAEAIGGTTSLTTAADGVCVRFHWEGHS